MNKPRINKPPSTLPRLKSPGRPATQKSTNPVAAAHLQMERAERLRKAGKLKEALAMCEPLIDKHPDYVGALQTLGLIQIDRGSYWQALSCFVRAAMLNPQDWTILTNLANVYLGLGADIMAAQTLEQALMLNDKDANVHFVLGQIYESQREYVRAVESFEQALMRDPSHAGALHLSGRCYGHLGEVGSAASMFTKSLRASSEPQNMLYSLYSLGQLPASVVELDILERLEKVIARLGDPDEKTRSRIAFIRAAAFDKEGMHGEAWSALLEANRIMAGEVEQDCKRYLTRNANTLEAVRRVKWKSAKEKCGRGRHPVSLFLLGPSRSGKTTLEFLVSGMEGVKRGYESGVVDSAARRTSQLAGLLTLNEPSQLPVALAGQFSSVYKEELGARLEGAFVFTNTHPGRINDVGSLAQSIPYCRFVFVKRKVEDIALRIFMKHYKDSTNPYAYDMDSIYRQIGWYHEIMDVWMEKLPKHCLMVEYESMLDDPQTALERVAELCGMAPPDMAIPALGDDRNCAAPYLDRLLEARGS